MSGPGLALVPLGDAGLLAQYERALRFEAPYLIEKLLKERIVETAAEAEALFLEAKKYLVLSHVDTDVSWNMYSARVDEVWHQFVLFTQQYADFCRGCFGEYLHHNPSNAPQAPDGGRLKPSTFEGFSARYQAFFGEPLPEVWLDSRSVSLSSRVINDNAGQAQVSVENGMACLTGPRGRTDVVVNDLAREALEFVARAGAFYVRELPGELTEEEKVGLIAALVEHRVLRIAP